MAAPDINYGQHIQDSFELAQAIQSSADEVLEREGALDLPTLSELSTGYYNAWAQTISQAVRSEGGYDPRVIQSIRRLNYALPAISSDADEFIRTAVLVPSLDSAMASSIHEVTGAEVESHTEESARATILLASQAAFMLNRIEDYGLNASSQEVHEFIGGISARMRLLEEKRESNGIILDDANNPGDELLGQGSDTDPDLAPPGAAGLEFDGRPVDGAGSEGEGVNEGSQEEDEVDITIPDSNWSLPHLRHLAMLLSSRFVYTRVQNNEADEYAGFYPGLYGENPALTQAVLAKLGFDLSFFTDQRSERRRMIRKDMLLRSWLEETDVNYQSEYDTNPDAVLRTRAKTTILNAIHHTDRPQAGKTFIGNARKRKVELVILDINHRIKALEREQAASVRS